MPVSASARPNKAQIATRAIDSSSDGTAEIQRNSAFKG